MCTWIFIAAVFITATWKLPKGLSTVDWINKWRYMHIRRHSPAMRMHWLRPLTNTALRETIPKEKSTHLRCSFRRGKIGKGIHDVQSVENGSPGWRKGHDRKEARGELPWVATLCYILKDVLSCTLTLRAPFRLDSHFCSKLRSKCVVNGKVTSLHCMVRKKKRKEKKKGLRPLHYPIVPPVMSF